MAQQAELKDSNMANHGSKEHKEQRTEAAKKEKAWAKVGQEEGITVWRIEKFEVVEWPKERYGEFYDGDSFIILHSYKVADSDAMKHNVHFWLGSKTSQDEAGSAAYKTVELDDYLGQLPVQYREVEGYESKRFLALFSKLKVLSGGIESGFNHVEPEKYEPRLLKVAGRCKKMQIYQVALQIESLNNCDAFILDGGLKLFQFNPGKCNVWEKRKANEIVDELQQQRKIPNKDTKIVEGVDDDQGADFWQYFKAQPKALPDVAPNDEDEKGGSYSDDFVKSVHKVTDESGDVEISVVAKAKAAEKFKRSVLDQNDCFIVDLGYSVFVYMGEKATRNERRESFKYACKYLTDSGRKANIPIVRITKQNETEEFAANFESQKKAASADSKQADNSNLKHKWQFGANFDAKNRQIVITVSDEVTSKNWELRLASSDMDGANIVSEYKKVVACVNAGTVKYAYPEEDNGAVDIEIKSTDDSYNFSVPPK